ncbi:uncharacterized protein LOC126687540 [Mercurialis annua]|uniref:uncharacterized protein LOC126687540 n=1 Tax=Mercurialis annua TaxID=3986 RepID=UPI00215DD871|nr:uncharacterized protein LOC126687540 [Mercurialis annua]
MANSSRENSPNKSNSPSDEALPVPTPAPLPIRAIHFGEGSSSVPVVGQGLIEGFSSSSSSSPSPSPPQRRVVQIALGGMGAGRGSGDPQMNRALAKNDDDNVAENKRKKGEMDAPKSEPICSICGKRFGSWKGVFGHLRAHPEREWRGAFPPPKRVTGSWSPIKMSGADDHQARQVQLLAPTMLDLARETLAKMREDSVAPAAGDGGGVASSRRVTNIDLNIEPGSSSSPSPPRGGPTLDLNKSPPESDDGNNGKE